MSDDHRPDPDQLLERLRAREEHERRAKLKIFFGASAGVGKTYAMLVEAHERRRAGADVLVGIVETHGRQETAALLEGLELLPRRTLDYKGATLEEFDLDGALARRPGLLLLDELAHTNAPGSRHAKRWQDVEELLAAGIDVYTTLNVQHVESHFDVVAQVTGIPQRETVPDSLIDRADEIELVDLPPDDLLQRLAEGKVYIPERARHAAENFFRKGNLIALRELAMRTAAEHVDAQMETYRRHEGIERGWPVGGRIVVGVGKLERAARLIRAARRMAGAMRAEWVVVHVERPGAPLTEAARARLVDVLTFAEELGAETALLSGPNVSEELLAFAHERNASRIVVGKPVRPHWLERLTGSVVERLVRESGDLDVFVITGERGEEGPRRSAPAPSAVRWSAYGGAVAAVAVAGLVTAGMRGFFELTNLAMIQLLAVVWVAVTLGRGPAIVASVLSVAVFDFFFVPPHLTFAVSDTQYLLTFAVMLVVAIVISTMASRLREQVLAAREDERRSAALARLSGQLAALQDRDALLGAALRQLEDVFGARGLVMLPGPGGRLAVAAGDPTLLGAGEHDHGVAQWSFDTGQPAGLGTATLPGSRCLYLPLKASGGEIGVLGILPASVPRLLAPDGWRLLEAFASQTALALERSRLAEAAEESRVRAETEHVRNALLSSVSHDLRTPLAAITGAADTLLDERLSVESRHEMARTIAEESARLNRLVGNLLQMTRLEAGALEVQRGWHALEEVIGAALRRVDPLLHGRRATASVPHDLPLATFDDVLIEQVVFNLLENAVKYAPRDGAIDVTAWRTGDMLEVDVADRGPGLPPGEEERVFAKFHRAADGQAEGAGLGLAIARGIVEAHGGRIFGRNRAGGGAVFSFTLPIGGVPPPVEPESPA